MASEIRRECARSPEPHFLAGEPVPWFRAATDGNPRYAFDTVAGRHVILAFLGSAKAHEPAAKAWAELTTAREAGLLDDDRACAFVVSVDPEDAQDGSSLRDQLPGLRVFRDHDLALSRQFGVLAQSPQKAGELRYKGFALLLDPALRVLASSSLAEIGGLIAMLTSQVSMGSAAIDRPAPILLLPRVFEPDFCRQLVELYDARGGVESGFMRAVEGQTVGIHDPRHKSRRDHEIEAEPVRQMMRERISRRLAPEIEKAFQYRATRIERYIVACYDAAEGGHFGPHRDNTTPGTAHRRFAVTINLNEDFDGGDLYFPEYGNGRHRAPLGGAVVFSCSLLHAVSPVMRGRRYATLPFLYDDAAAQSRQRMGTSAGV